MEVETVVGHSNLLEIQSYNGLGLRWRRADAARAREFVLARWLCSILQLLQRSLGGIGMLFLDGISNLAHRQLGLGANRGSFQLR